MGRLDTMTDPQRGAVMLIRAGVSLKGVRKPTRDALLRDGYIAQTEAGWRLTDAGNALFVEDAQRGNKPGQFREGDVVQWIDWDSRLVQEDSPLVTCRVVRVTSSL